MSKTLKLSSGTGIKILGVIIIFGVILGGTTFYYGWYSPQQQQNQQNLLALLGIPYGGGTVNLLCAGSVQGVLTTAKTQFEALHPGVHIYISSYGSLQCAQNIKNGQPCDIFFSADFNVMKDELYQVPVPQTPLINYTDWWVDFARNTIVVAYTTSGPTHLTLDNTTWYTILTTGIGKWARANPDADPCGYRSLIMLNISDTYYPTDPTYNSTYPVGVLAYVLSNPPSIQIVAKEADMMPLLVAGTLDAGFTYLSLAIQSGLSYVTLPDNVSLGNALPEYNTWYSQWSITTSKPATYWGSAIKYAATIPNTANYVNRFWAIQFLYFVLSSQGQAILTAGGQPVVNPPVAEGVWSAVPSLIQSVCIH